MDFDMKKIMEQAKAMQESLEAAKKKQATKEFEGSVFEGKVKVIISPTGTGSYKVKKVIIDPTVIAKEDIETVEDLIAAAFNNAMKKAEDDDENAFSGLIPKDLLPDGFKMPF